MPALNTQQSNANMTKPSYRDSNLNICGLCKENMCICEYAQSMSEWKKMVTYITEQNFISSRMINIDLKSVVPNPPKSVKL